MSDREFYRKSYLEDITPWGKDNPEKPFEKFLGYIKESGYEPRIIIDLGCGEGRHIALSKKFFPNAKVIGIDYVDIALQKAKNKLHKEKVYLICGDILKIPIKSIEIDIVIDFGVYHHIRKKQKKEYMKVLERIKEGGFFLLGVFSTNFKHHINEERKRNFIYHRKHYDRFFTEEEIKNEIPLKPIEIFEEGEGIKKYIYALFQK